MNTFVALLRGINVGGKNTLPMKELTKVLEAVGLMNVRTYIQSGNVVFQTTTDNIQELSQDIKIAINKSHGFTPGVFVLSIQQLRDAVTSNPFPEAENDPKSLHLSFLRSSPTDPDLERLRSLQADNEEFRLLDTVFYLHAPGGIGRSRLAANVEKALGVPLTARNWRSAISMLSMATEMAVSHENELGH